MVVGEDESGVEGLTEKKMCLEIVLCLKAHLLSA